MPPDPQNNYICRVAQWFEQSTPAQFLIQRESARFNILNKDYITFREPRDSS